MAVLVECVGPRVEVVEVEAAGAVEGFFGCAGEAAAREDGVFVAVLAGGGFYADEMTVVVHLPDEVAQQLEAEAARRGVTVEQLTVETLRRYYELPSAKRATDALDSFIGSGSSGRREAFDIRQVRSDVAARKFGEGA